MRITSLILLVTTITGCNINVKREGLKREASVKTESGIKGTIDSRAKSLYSLGDSVINTGNTSPNDLVAYAETLKGIPYKYASTDPHSGFDCSGFITFVFNHFKISVPRSSVEFTNVEKRVPLQESLPGDVILFTGTDSTIKTVGHMGIIVMHQGPVIQFIHSTSGKANGVTITQLNDYYRSRFVKVIRVFKNNRT